MRRWFWRSAAFAMLSLLAVPLTLSAQKREVERVNGRDSAAREVIVKFRSGATGALNRIAADADADEALAVGNGRMARVHSRSKNIEALMEELRRNPDVERVEPNYIVYANSTVPNDTYFSLMWGLQNTGQTIGGQTGTPGVDIQATNAWDISTGSSSVVVGIVDTGVDYTHTDLAANVWSAPSQYTVTVGGRSITCAAGTHGFNAIKLTCDPKDDNDHGTHVSGTIGAKGNNGTGVTGINWTSSIVGLKFLNRNGSGTTADAINAIEFAVQLKSKGIANVRVLNNSWGGAGFSQSLLDAINDANAQDILFVVAAGNEGANNDTTATYPANYTAPNIIRVAATDNQDALASFSNYGATTVDLGAPGVYIASTVRSNGYAYMSGTSMATPHVSGAAALILSKCSLSTASLLSTILGHVDPVSALAGKTVTGGRLNVYKAISSCAGSSPTPDFALSASPSSATVTAGGSATSTVTVSPTNSFASAVALTATGLPSGASANFSPASISGGSGSSTLTVSTTSPTPAGTYTITVTGTGSGGSPVHTTTFKLTVNAVQTGTFTLGASPSLRTLRRNKSTTFTATVTASGGFNSAVSFSVSGLPSGVTASFSPTSVTGSGSTTLTLKASNSAAISTSTLTITAAGGGITKTASVLLFVTR